MIWFLLLFCLLFRWGYQGSPEHYQMKVNVLVLSDILWPHGLVLKARFLEWVAFSLLQGFPGASEGKHLPAMWETWVQSLGQQDFLEKEMATHSVLLPEKFHRWRMWMEEEKAWEWTERKLVRFCCDSCHPTVRNVVFRSPRLFVLLTDVKKSNWESQLC